MEKRDNRTEKRKIGDIGENIACDFLKKRGFEILDRNYLRKWGEIDIIARKGGVIRFLEVKSARSSAFLYNEVSRGTQIGDKNTNKNRYLGGSHATPIPEQSSLRGKHFDRGYRPEDNMHPWKVKRLMRAIQTYLIEKDINLDWQLDLVTVRIDMKSRMARVEILENIII